MSGNPTPLIKIGQSLLCTDRVSFKNLVFRVYRTPVTPKNMKILTISEFDEIRMGNYILLDESNGEVRFVIRDLEIFSGFQPVV